MHLIPIGKPREIVTPSVVQVVIQEDGRKQAELEGAAGLKLLDDLPGREILFVSAPHFPPQGEVGSGHGSGL